MSIRIKADLHVHTVCSDGSAGGEEIVRAALVRGLRAVAITDHDTFSGYLLVSKAVETMGAGLIVIPGNEVRTNYGDLVILCEALPERAAPRDAEELVDFARENSCIVFAPHPYDLRRLGAGDRIRGLRLDAIEIHNTLADPLANWRASRAARELGLPGLSNSDAHIPGFVGAAHNIVAVESLSAGEILESIRRGRVENVKGRPAPHLYLAHALRRTSESMCAQR